MPLIPNKGRSNLHPGLFDGSKDDILMLSYLFFDEPLITRLITCTNLNALQKRHEELQSNPQIRQRSWINVTRSEILGYIGIVIYLNVAGRHSIKHCWNTDYNKSALHPCMTYARYQQTHRYFHIFGTEIDLQQHQNTTPTTRILPHHKANPLGSYLRAKWQQFWHCGTYITVDEAMQKFTGRSDTIVTIPGKPTPTGYKIWVLVDHGYVYNYVWHTPGNISVSKAWKYL